MMNKTDINMEVATIIGDVYAIEAKEGQKVFAIIKKAFEENSKVVLSFLNIKIVATAFLNAAIGELYRDFSEEYIRENLKFENLNESSIVKLKKVVDTAKLRYNNPDFYKKLQQSVEEILKR
ncbi:MAG: STAS-like domain-containing protein [Prevotellaceae bacterium]|jgi:hypothetical protein|nr:STAS-like domain-containing protein [Prevotellaceae bacterium]